MAGSMIHDGVCPQCSGDQSEGYNDDLRTPTFPNGDRVRQCQDCGHVAAYDAHTGALIA